MYGLTVLWSYWYGDSFGNDNLLFFLFNSPQSLLPDISELIVKVEFIRDDGYRKTHEDDTHNCTHGPYHKTPHRLRVLVAIANSRHGNHGPPEADRYVGEMACREVVLCVIHDTRKNDHTDYEDK